MPGHVLTKDDAGNMQLLTCSIQLISVFERARRRQSQEFNGQQLPKALVDYNNSKFPPFITSSHSRDS